MLPREIIDALGLQESATVDAQLGDGSAVVMASYTCLVEWLGTERIIEVIVSSGRFPLLAVGLLLDNKLTIDYLLREVRVE